MSAAAAAVAAVTHLVGGNSRQFQVAVDAAVQEAGRRMRGCQSTSEQTKFSNKFDSDVEFCRVDSASAEEGREVFVV